MKIIITGGLGFIGSFLCEKLSKSGHEISVLARSSRGKIVPDNVSIIEADTTKPGEWQDAVVEHNIIINLAGTNIFRRWNKNIKKAIYDSRILTTDNIVKAILAKPEKSYTLLNASAAGYYGFHDNEIIDETGQPGNDFLASVAHGWEEMALKADNGKNRVVLCRFGIVFGRKGGALPKMALAHKLFMGSVFGNGKQWFSWIHEDDLSSIFEHLINNKNISGPVNCTSPQPVTNKELTHHISRALNRRILIPFIPGFLLKLVLGEIGDVILNGQRAVPRKLLDSNFNFKFPEMENALNDLIKK